MESSVLLHNLDNLKRLCANGFQSNFLDSALRRIIERQIAQDETDLLRASDGLVEFESQYGLSSEEFWRRFQAGEMNDTADYMEWNILSKAHQRITARLRILKGDEADE